MIVWLSISLIGLLLFMNPGNAKFIHIGGKAISKKKTQFLSSVLGYKSELTLSIIFLFVMLANLALMIIHLITEIKLLYYPFPIYIPGLISLAYTLHGLSRVIWRMALQVKRPPAYRPFWIAFNFILHIFLYSGAIALILIYGAK